MKTKIKFIGDDGDYGSFPSTYEVDEPRFIPQMGEHVDLPVYEGSVCGISHEYKHDGEEDIHIIIIKLTSKA